MLLVALLILRLWLALIAALLIVILLIFTLLILVPMMLLPTVGLLVSIILMIAMVTLGKLLRHLCRATLQIDVHSPRVCLRRVLQAKFLTHLLYPGLDFLNVMRGVIAFADDTAGL